MLPGYSCQQLPVTPAWCLALRSFLPSLIYGDHLGLLMTPRWAGLALVPYLADKKASLDRLSK